MAVTKPFNDFMLIPKGFKRHHWLILVGFLNACGGTPTTRSSTTTSAQHSAPTATPNLESERIKVSRMGELYRELGDGVDDAGADCDRASDHLRQWVAAHQAEVKQLNEELTTIPPKHVEQLAPSLEKAMRRSVLQLRDASTRCQGHQNFYDAFSSLRL